MRLPLTDHQEDARAAALLRYEPPTADIGELARSTDCLPIYVDWTGFLGLGKGGECVWVDHDEHGGAIMPAIDLLQLSIFAARVHLVPGLAGLAPPRPAGREDCSQCGGQGHLALGNTRVGCHCGGLGSLPTSPAELGFVGS